jgi:hypothetical protein
VLPRSDLRRAVKSIQRPQPKSSRARTALETAVTYERSRTKLERSRAAALAAAAAAEAKFAPQAPDAPQLPEPPQALEVEPWELVNGEVPPELGSGVIARVPEPHLFSTPAHRRARKMSLGERRELRLAKRERENERWYRSQVERQRREGVIEEGDEPLRVFSLDTIRMRNAIHPDTSGRAVSHWLARIARGYSGTAVWSAVRAALCVQEDAKGVAARVTLERQAERARRAGKQWARTERDDPKSALLVRRTWQSQRARNILITHLALLMNSERVRERSGQWRHTVRGFSVANLQWLLRSPHERDPKRTPSRFTFSGVSRRGQPGYIRALERAGALYRQQLPKASGKLAPWEVGNRTGRAFNRYWLVGLTDTCSLETSMRLAAWHEAGADVVALWPELVVSPRDRAPP